MATRRTRRPRSARARSTFNPNASNQRFFDRTGRRISAAAARRADGRLRAGITIRVTNRAGRRETLVTAGAGE